MNLRTKSFLEAFIALLAIGSFTYVFVLEDWLTPKLGHPIDVIKVQAPDVLDPTKANQFIVSFYKNRDDCHSPTISRMIVNPSTGQTAKMKANLGHVVQYPKSKTDKPFNLEIWAWPEGKTFPPGSAFMLTDQCYSCPESRYCKAYHTEEFLVLDRSLDVGSELN